MAFHSSKDNRRHSHHRKKRSSISEINITPFVDVLLVLLIIFMVAAPMMTGSVELTLPKGSNAVKEKIEPVTVSIKADGSIYLQEEAVKIRTLPAKLLTLTNNNTDTKIFLRADQKLDYGRVMDVVQSINSAGFTQVSLVTELSNN